MIHLAILYPQTEVHVSLASAKQGFVLSGTLWSVETARPETDESNETGHDASCASPSRVSYPKHGAPCAVAIRLSSARA